jgi:ABC-type polysaccharide/polyol phosphate transport system ATPase subunit
VGDSAFQEKCFARIKDFRLAGKTILFVSHAMPSVTRFCDRVILLDKGSIIADGDPAEVVSFYNSLAFPELAAAH